MLCSVTGGEEASKDVREMPKVIKLAPHKDVPTTLSLRADIKSLRCHAFPRGELLKKSCFRTLLKKCTMEKYLASLLLLSARYKHDFLQFINKSRAVCSRYERSSYIIIILHFRVMYMI